MLLVAWQLEQRDEWASGRVTGSGSIARAFAMHGIAQWEGRDASRYGLWTGDLGLAYYLWSGISESWRGMPVIDVL